MSHHDHGIRSFQSYETLSVTEDNQYLGMILWMASIPRMYSDRNSAYRLFPPFYIKQLRLNSVTDCFYYPAHEHNFPVSESGWECVTCLKCGSWTLCLFPSKLLSSDRSLVKQKSP